MTYADMLITAALCFAGAIIGNIAAHYIMYVLGFFERRGQSAEAWELQSGSSHLTPLEQDMLRMLREQMRQTWPRKPPD